MARLLIAGGGFAGVWAAMAAAATRARGGVTDLQITVVSNSDHLCIRPRLYEGAAPDMLVALRPLFDEIGVDLQEGEIAQVSNDRIQLHSGAAIAHCRLILATGSQVSLPPVPGADEHGFAVDSHTGTMRLDAHLSRLDASHADEKTIVVVGASFTGLEVSTKLRSRLGPDFRIVLIDRSARPGEGLGPSLAEEIRQALDVTKIAFHGEETVTEVSDRHVRLSSGITIETCTTIFATGFHASNLANTLEAERDAAGRLRVNNDLRVSGQSRIFAAGDVAAAMADSTHPTLMSCQHAMPMGVAAGRNAVLDLLGRNAIPYSQPDYATCLDLGPAGAVFTNGWERTVVMTGQEGAAMKAQINTQWIYPPDPAIGKAAIFERILPA